MSEPSRKGKKKKSLLRPPVDRMVHSPPESKSQTIEERKTSNRIGK